VAQLDAVACRCVLKAPGAILGPSSLPVVVGQPDKRLQTEPFCIGSDTTNTKHTIIHTRREEDSKLVNTRLQMFLATNGTSGKTSASGMRRMGFNSRADQISHTLPTTRYRCNLDVWALAQNRGDGNRSLVTPPKGYWASMLRIWFFCFYSSKQTRIEFEKVKLEQNICSLITNLTLILFQN